MTRKLWAPYRYNSRSASLHKHAKVIFTFFDFGASQTLYCEQSSYIFLRSFTQAEMYKLCNSRPRRSPLKFALRPTRVLYGLNKLGEERHYWQYLLNVIPRVRFQHSNVLSRTFPPSGLGAVQTMVVQTTEFQKGERRCCCTTIMV